MHVLAIGGGGFVQDARYRAAPGPLITYALSLTGVADPKVTALYTATGDDVQRVVNWHSAWVGTSVRASHLALFPMPNVDDVRAHVLGQHAVYVGGGSVANLLAVWRVHGLVDVFREAAAAGVVLFGVSAGSLCWFTGGTTDSYGPVLQPVTDGVGIVKASNCPHYGSEALRRPTYQHLVAAGTIAAGWAADDNVGLHFTSADGPPEVVAAAEGFHGYRVEQDGNGGVVETLLPARLLPA